MNKVLRNKTTLLWTLLPEISFENPDFEKYKEARGLFIEDPWLRLKSIFYRNDYGDIHPELNNALIMTQIGFVSGGMIGSLKELQKFVENFIRTNETTIYHNKRSAYRELSFRGMSSMGKGFFLFGPKIGFAFGTFSLVSSCCELYRNKPKIVDNVIAGFVIGALSKFSFGIKGMISGGVVGGVLGSVYGCFMWGCYKLTGTDHLQIKYAHFALSQQVQKAKKGAIGVKDPFYEKLEKSGLYASHNHDPLNAIELNITEKPMNKI